MAPRDARANPSPAVVIQPAPLPTSQSTAPGGLLASLARHRERSRRPPGRCGKNAGMEVPTQVLAGSQRWGSREGVSLDCTEASWPPSLSGFPSPRLQKSPADGAGEREHRVRESVETCKRGGGVLPRLGGPGRRLAVDCSGPACSTRNRKLQGQESRRTSCEMLALRLSTHSRRCRRVSRRDSRRLHRRLRVRRRALGSAPETEQLAGYTTGRCNSPKQPWHT